MNKNKLTIKLSLNELETDKLKIDLLRFKVNSEVCQKSPTCKEDDKKYHENLAKKLDMVLKQIDSGTVSLDQDQIKERELNNSIDNHLGLILIAYAEGLGGDDE